MFWSGSAGTLSPAQQGANTGQQFVAAEGFDQVVIGTGVESANAVFDLAFRGQHENRSVLTEPTQLAGHRESVELRHHDVEQDQVGLLLAGAIESAGAIGGADHAVAGGGQTIRQGGAHGPFVFDDENAGHQRAGLGPARGSSRVKVAP